MREKIIEIISEMVDIDEAADKILALSPGYGRRTPCPHDLLTGLGRPVDGCEICHGKGSYLTPIPLGEWIELVEEVMEVMNFHRNMDTIWNFGSYVMNLLKGIEKLPEEGKG